MDRHSRVGASFQGTYQAVALGLPQYRVQGDLTAEIWKNTSVGAHLVYEKDYKSNRTGSTNGGAAVAGTNRSSFAGLLGISVRFA